MSSYSNNSLIIIAEIGQALDNDNEQEKNYFQKKFKIKKVIYMIIMEI